MANKRITILWTPHSEKDLQQVHDYIAQDAPRTAIAFAKRIKAAVRRLKDFPEAGAVVEDLDDPDVREIPVGSYRVICRFQHPTVFVLAVRHGARLLNKRDLLSE